MVQVDAVRVIVLGWLVSMRVAMHAGNRWLVPVVVMPVVVRVRMLVLERFVPMSVRV